MLNLIALSSSFLFLIFLGPPLVFLFLLYEYRKTAQRAGNEAARTQLRKNVPYVGATALLWLLLLGSGSDYLKDIAVNEPVNVTGTVISVNEKKKSKRRSIVAVEVLTSDGELLELKIAPSCAEDYQLVTDTLYHVSYYPQSFALCEANAVERVEDDLSP